MRQLKYTVRTSNKYKRELRKVLSRGYQLQKLDRVIEIIASGENLPAKYAARPLHGNMEGYRECHVEFDWVLVYRIYQDELILLLTGTGTHSDIF